MTALLRLVLSIVAVGILSTCNDSPVNDAKTLDNTNPFNLNEGDSIPLQTTLDYFDSEFIKENKNSIDPLINLKMDLENLKAKQVLDSSNNFLKIQINELEADIRLIESINESMIERDSIINVILSRADSLK